MMNVGEGSGCKYMSVNALLFVCCYSCISLIVYFESLKCTFNEVLDAEITSSKPDSVIHTRVISVLLLPQIKCLLMSRM